MPLIGVFETPKVAQKLPSTNGTAGPTVAGIAGDAVLKF